MYEEREEILWIKFFIAWRACKMYYDESDV